MTPRHGTGKADANQAEIVAHVRSIPGAYIKVVSMHPRMLDLLVFCNGVLTCWEVKPDEAAKLTEAERDIWASCPGAVFVVRSVADAEDVLVNVHGLDIV